MASDICLDKPEGTEWITMDATAIHTTASDIIIDCPLRRHHDKPKLRRALVHDESDGLTINFNRDYPGGITLNDAQVRLKVHLHVGRDPELPRRAVIGELYAVNCIPEVREVAIDGLFHAVHDRKDTKAISKAFELVHDEITRFDSDTDISLWLCIGTNSFGHARWQRISLAETVDGTL